MSKESAGLATSGEGVAPITAHSTIAYSFLAVILILTATTLLGARHIGDINTRLAHTVQEHEQQLKLLHSMRELTTERIRLLQSPLITDRPHTYDAPLRQLPELSQRYLNAQRQLQSQPLEQHERELLQQQYRQIIDADTVQRKFLTLLREAHGKEAREVMNSQLLPILHQAIAVLDQVITRMGNHNHRNLQQSSHEIHITYAQMLALTLLGLLFSLGIVYRISRLVNAEIKRRLERESTLQHNELRERTLRDNILDGILSLDENGTILTCNRACESLFGYPREELIGQSAELLLPSQGEGPVCHTANRQLTANRRKLRLLGSGHEVSACRKDRVRFPAEVDVSRMEFEGETSYIVLVRDMTYKRAVELWLERFNQELEQEVRQRTHELATANGRLRAEIEEHIQTQKKLTYLASHDPLTELPNRGFFTEQLNTALFHAERRGQQLALLFMDLDGFKQVNDTHGHKAGDQLLLKVTRRIRQTVRREDIVARMGGDEFTVILGELQQAADAEMIAQKIIEAISRPVECAGAICRVGISIGISYFPQNADHPDTLIRLADDAMYEAKASGKNCYCCCQSSNQLGLHLS